MLRKSTVYGTLSVIALLSLGLVLWAAFVPKPGSPKLSRAILDQRLATALSAWNVPEAVRLVEAGADPDTRNDRGYTTLMLACNVDWFAPIVRVLAHGASVKLARSDGWTALHQAANAGNTKAVELLIQKGAEVNPRQDDGRTPLMFAAYNHPETVKALLRHGANPAAKDKDGQTAYDNAKWAKREDIAFILRASIQDHSKRAMAR